MAVLILAELNGNDLSEDATSKAVSAAKGLGDIHVLCASSNCSGAATSAAKLNGAVSYTHLTLPTICSV